MRCCHRETSHEGISGRFYCWGGICLRRNAALLLLALLALLLAWPLTCLAFKIRDRLSTERPPKRLILPDRHAP
jgi:hypothetical protein